MYIWFEINIYMIYNLNPRHTIMNVRLEVHTTKTKCQIVIVSTISDQVLSRLTSFKMFSSIWLYRGGKSPFLLKM